MNIAQKLTVPNKMVSTIKSVYANELDHALYIADGYAVLFAHGNKQGLIKYKGAANATSHVLKDLVDTHGIELKQKGVKVIYTLSCYGGLQERVKYKGINMVSMHNNTTAIYVSAISNGYIAFMSEEVAKEAFNGTETYVKVFNIPTLTVEPVHHTRTALFAVSNVVICLHIVSTAPT